MRDESAGGRTPEIRGIVTCRGFWECRECQKCREIRIIRKSMSNMRHFTRHEDAKPEVMNNGITKRILSYDDSLMVEELIFEEGAQSKMHTHTPVQIPYVKCGVFEFTAGDETFVLKEGDTAYMGPDEPHCVKCLEAGTLVVAFSPVRKDYL